MTLLDDYSRVSKSRTCPICGKSDWCLISKDEATAICARTGSTVQFGEAGYLHRLLNKTDRQRRPAVRRLRIPTSTTLPSKRAEFARLSDKFRDRITPDGLDRVASTLGLTPQSLHRLRIGWTGRAWSFPMVDACGRVIGIRLRYPTGGKFAVTGSKNGLFVPDGLNDHSPLLVAEGPTDCAALLDFGFDVIGRPSCSTGARLVVEFVVSLQIQNVVIVADSDEPGQRGARSLAASLVTRVPRVRVITPPPGQKDIRSWKTSGAVRADADGLIAVAEDLGAGIRVRRVAQ